MKSLLKVPMMDMYMELSNIIKGKSLTVQETFRYLAFMEDYLIQLESTDESEVTEVVIADLARQHSGNTELPLAEMVLYFRVAAMCQRLLKE